MKYVPIEFEKTSFNCPLCGAFSEHKWSYAHKFDKYAANYRGEKEYLDTFDDLVFSQCQHCQQHTIWIEDDDAGNKLIYPTTGTTPLPNEDLPKDIIADFNEARSIVEISPRGSVALLRLCIQKLCIHLGEKGKNINADIGNLVKKGLPEKLQRALDSVRVIGNNAVHPGQIDVTDDKEIAYKLFGFINIIADVLITQPKQIDEFYDLKVPDSAKEAISKRDKK